MSFWNDLDRRLQRAVQHENRRLSHPINGTTQQTNKRKISYRQRCGLLGIMLSPLGVLFVILYLRQLYTVLSDYELQQQYPHLRQSPTESKTIIKTNKKDLSSPDNVRNVELDLDQDQEQRSPPPQQQQGLRASPHQENTKQPPQRESTPSIPIVQRETNDSQNTNTVVVLTTEYGRIQIRMRPDLSKESVEYVEKIVQRGECSRCQFYRAEHPYLLQGIVKHKAIPVNTVGGPCPMDKNGQTLFPVPDPKDCPEWDPNCGCHGPIMDKGSVGWAGGAFGGPDFFINTHPGPATWWGTQHTNFGSIEDETSFNVLKTILKLPVKQESGMSMLIQSVPFQLSFLSSSSSSLKE